MKEAAHLLRLAAILFAGGAIFAGFRQAIVPAGFGQLGHYRPAALADAQARPASFAGRASCALCHEEEVQVLSKGRHSAIGCEACHGALASHADNPDRKPELPNTAVLCARCHEAVLARPKRVPQVVSKEHSGGELCKSCHQPHSPKI